MVTVKEKEVLLLVVGWGYGKLRLASCMSMINKYRQAESLESAW